jgi:hypothetical protein
MSISDAIKEHPELSNIVDSDSAKDNFMLL